MKEKDEYMLEDLYLNLAIKITELSKLTDMSEGTIRRIRHGLPTRRSTANKLLQVFSEIYKRDLSLDNVKGINLEEKEPDEQDTKTYAAIDEHRLEPSVPSSMGKDTSTKKKASVAPSDGTFASAFLEAHGAKSETTARRWLTKWITEGKLIEHIDFTEVPRIGKQGTFRALTEAGQQKVLELLRSEGKLK